MKSTGNLRSSGHFGAEEASHKATKLPPLKKSGKERHSLYRELDQADDEDEELRLLNKRESALDYYDDEDTEELWDDEEEDTEDQWEEEDEDDADDLSEDWADEEDESWNDEDGEADDWKE
jgi:hypothetical protein